jgi:predicted dehydrogenase
VIGNLFRRLEARFLLDPHAGTLGVGLVGVGGWGSTNALNLVRTERFDILGVHDTNPDFAAKFSKRYKTRRFDRYDDLLQDANFRAVVLTVPNAFHVDLARGALEAGKHVFVEKPLASGPEDCRRLGNLAASKNLTLFVGHQVRREPALREIERRLNSGELGCPILASGWNTQRRTGADWRTDPRSCPGGSMEQLGVHWIDVFLYLFGPPRIQSGWSLNIPRAGSGPEWGHLDLEFEGGVRGTVDSSYTAPDSFGLSVQCEKGTLQYEGGSLVLGMGEKKTVLHPEGLPGGIAQFHEFADCIEGKAIPETDAETAAIVMDCVARMVPYDKRSS